MGSESSSTAELPQMELPWRPEQTGPPPTPSLPCPTDGLIDNLMSPSSFWKELCKQYPDESLCIACSNMMSLVPVVRASPRCLYSALAPPWLRPSSLIRTWVLLRIKAKLHYLICTQCALIFGHLFFHSPSFAHLG